MKKFLALYMTPSALMEEWEKNLPPGEMKEVMDAWMSWMTEHASILADQGSPLGKTLQLNKDGVTPMANDIRGYFIVHAESQEEAARIVSTHPTLNIPGSSIQLMAVNSIPTTQ